MGLLGSIGRGFEWLGENAGDVAKGGFDFLGLTDYEGEERRRELARNQRSRDAEMRSMLSQILEGSYRGSQSFLEEREQDIDRRFRESSGRYLRDAARRGLVHSGYAGTMGRDLQRERAGALTQASAQADERYQRAQQLAAALLSGMHKQQMGLDLGLEQMAMASDRDFLDYLGRLQELIPLGETLGFGSGGSGGGGRQFKMVDD